MTATSTDHIASQAIRIIHGAFDDWIDDFQAVTLRALARFEQREWRKGQADWVERLALYQRHVEAAVVDVRDLLSDRACDRSLWHDMKTAYGSLVDSQLNVELADTFFSSVSRRIFATIGVDPDIEFVEPPEPTPHADTDPQHVTRLFPCHGSVDDLLRRILEAYAFSVPYEDLDRDITLAASAIASATSLDEIKAIELARPAFFRNKGAYLVGRILCSGGHVPLVIPLLHADGSRGVTVDAILATEDEVSVVFSFARSYFFVETDRPRDLVAFLHSIMPRKPIAELYIGIGSNKHAKREQYRDLQQHLRISDDRFEIARGARGMVMIVFTLPSHDVIYKVFRDRFDYPKTTTRAQVMQKYELVFQHDRAGRLIDAQEFEYLEFDIGRFSHDLLHELTTCAAESVTIRGSHVVIKHLYTERRVAPLDLYLNEADEASATGAVLDYGTAVRDLAVTNIFPGDLLLKNFGVTRHGRVVFYDYDEICPVTECRFRRLPPPRTEEEEMSGEAWFYVDDRDVFPEEFLSFLEVRGSLRDVFVSAHGYLLDIDFWIRTQKQLAEGGMIDIFPYPQAKRLLQGVDAMSDPHTKVEATS